MSVYALTECAVSDWLKYSLVLKQKVSLKRWHVSIHTTGHHTLEDHYLNTCHHENLKPPSHINFCAVPPHCIEPRNCQYDD
jgi:hypothetical protein